ncbi:hypothetical protein TNCV_2003001 [Trichonephila clavipes]|nr:hypothetical protein TNCV_2003001 [Trichonephila clavipes]
MTWSANGYFRGYKRIISVGVDSGQRGALSLKLESSSLLIPYGVRSFDDVTILQRWKDDTFGSPITLFSRLKCYQNLWSHLERAVQKYQITSKEQLKSVLQEEWLNIAPETTRHLVESMPRRLEAFISSKGYATK